MGIETTTLEISGKGIGWIWEKAIKPFFVARKRREKELFEMVNNIHSELRFNGGGSIKDAIWEVRSQLSDIDTRLTVIQENQHIAMNLQGIAFWISNDIGECVYASTNLCKLTGRNEQDLMGNNWIAWVVERERIYDSWNFSVENKSAFDEYYTFKKADGTYQKVWGLAFHKKINGVHAGTMGKLEAVGEPTKEKP